MLRDKFMRYTAGHLPVAAAQRFCDTLLWAGRVDAVRGACSAADVWQFVLLTEQ